MTAKRGLFWYVDGELLCFPVSGDEANTVSNNHRRFWETLPHSLTGGVSYNYFPRGRVELRHGKALVYLHPTLCTPGIDTRIRHAFSLPDEMQLSLKADGSRHYRSIQEGQDRLRRYPAIPGGNSIPIQHRGKNVLDLVLQDCHAE